jgi:hypothetical protein
VVEPGTLRSHKEVSARAGEAKKQAKRMPGSALFLERRNPANTELVAGRGTTQPE